MRILIEVVEARGSAPRDAGAWMVVGPEGAEGTIGGGRLEWDAMAAARAMLAAGEAAREMDVALGPAIGQCCGGRVRLRLTAVGPEALAARRAAEAALLPQVWVFGAGHVGAALARALAALPVRATVVDGRAEALAALEGALAAVSRGVGGRGGAADRRDPDARDPHPGPLPQGGRGGANDEGGGFVPAVAQPVRMSPSLPLAGEGQGEGFSAFLTPLPEAAVRGAQPGAAFVIATHDHALDFLLAAEALARGDAAYVGMIGSATKRAAFARFARERGVDPGRLVCPIGGPSGDKRPAVIAALTAAEVMRALAGRETPPEARARL